MDLQPLRARRDWLAGSLGRWKRSGRLSSVRDGSDALQCRSRVLGSLAFRGELDADCLRTERPPVRRRLDAERGLDALLPEMEAVCFLGLGIWLCRVDRSPASRPLHLLSDTAGPIALPDCCSMLARRCSAECSALEVLAGIAGECRRSAIAAVSATLAHCSCKAQPQLG